MFVIDLLIYFNVSEELEKFRFSESFGFIHHIGGHIYTVFIYFLTHVFLKKHTIEINNQYTSTIGKELYWAKSFMLVGVFFTLIIHFTSKFNNYYLDLTEAIINVGLLYWICIHGIRQQTVKNLVQESDFITEKRSKSKNEVEINETDKVLFNHIEQMIISKNIYKNPDLTIIDIANLTNKHPKKISTVINEVSNKNFKTFINGFRINEAKDILKNVNSNDYSIEGISLEVGFKSKSAFYDAFRKETGTTPTKFKNQQ
ncbi:helix-turn-helix domain-containing protein [Tenacibaculum sp. ZS6-P6]|uniref:helix-turn-helix domain-containing protein n=1 Tax=Tenacibaculum sp. ZS6-P6 TaxID=3447503 RepID=UPI003F968266